MTLEPLERPHMVELVTGTVPGHSRGCHRRDRRSCRRHPALCSRDDPDARRSWRPAQDGRGHVRDDGRFGRPGSSKLAPCPDRVAPRCAGGARATPAPIGRGDGQELHERIARGCVGRAAMACPTFSAHSFAVRCSRSKSTPARRSAANISLFRPSCARSPRRHCRARTGELCISPLRATTSRSAMTSSRACRPATTSRRTRRRLPALRRTPSRHRPECHSAPRPNEPSPSTRIDRLWRSSSRRLRSRRMPTKRPRSTSARWRRASTRERSKRHLSTLAR